MSMITDVYALPTLRWLDFARLNAAGQPPRNPPAPVCIAAPEPEDEDDVMALYVQARQAWWYVTNQESRIADLHEAARAGARAEAAAVPTANKVSIAKSVRRGNEEFAALDAVYERDMCNAPDEVKRRAVESMWRAAAWGAAD